jgi:hypothetical protein
VLPFGRPASDTASEAGRREKLVVMRKPLESKKYMNIRLISTFILVVFSIFLTSCASPLKKTLSENIKNEDFSGNIKIILKSEIPDTALRLRLYLMKKKPIETDFGYDKDIVYNYDIKLGGNINSSSEVNISLPSGIYYAYLKINDIMIVPTLFTYNVNKTIRFGYRVKDNGNKIIDNTKCTTLKEPSSFFSYLYCPKLIVKSEDNLTLEFLLKKPIKFDLDLTAQIWYSLIDTRLIPVIPVLMGVVAFKREIEYNNSNTIKNVDKGIEKN